MQNNHSFVGTDEPRTSCEPDDNEPNEGEVDGCSWVI